MSNFEKAFKNSRRRRKKTRNATGISKEELEKN